jgi:hypothetical protein
LISEFCDSAILQSCNYFFAIAIVPLKV